MKASELNDDPFAHADSWPELAGQTTDASKKHQKWLGVLVNEIRALRVRCTALEQENAELKKSVNEKGKGSWSSLFNAKDGKRSEEQTKFFATVAKESRIVAKTECNLVVNGLLEPTANDDEHETMDIRQREEKQKDRERAQLDDLLHALGADISDVVDFKRLKTTRRATATAAAAAPASSAATATASATTVSAPPTSAASASAATGHRLRPTPLLVQFKCTQYRDRALQAARDLRESDTFGKVYLDIDKTQAERAEEYKLRRLRNEENAKLPNVVEGSEGRQRYGIDAKSNRKFFYGIRSGATRKIFIN